MAHGQNAARHYGRDLWAKRPFSGWPHDSNIKRMCRRYERRVEEQQQIVEELENTMTEKDYGYTEGVGLIIEAEGARD